MFYMHRIVQFLHMISFAFDQKAARIPLLLLGKQVMK